MKAKQYYKVEIMVHPAVFRYLDNKYTKVMDAYDFRSDPLYFAVSGMLMRNNVKMPSRISKKIETYIPIAILITGFDFYHYGYLVPLVQQYHFSQFMLSLIEEKAFYKIMLAHKIGGIPRDRAIKEFLAENFFEHHEMNYANLRKKYQRKYQHNEQEIEDFMRNTRIDSGVHKRHPTSTINDVLFVPKLYLL